jgi:hypothetical protein
MEYIEILDFSNGKISYQEGSIESLINGFNQEGYYLTAVYHPHYFLTKRVE